MKIADYLPAKYRKFIYTCFASIAPVEGLLDTVGWGLLTVEQLAVILGVSAVLGFGLARANTTDIIVVAEGE